MLPMQPQGQGSLISTPITPDPTTLFACDDPALMTQYLPGYASLQPTQVTGVQPAPRREEMVYPEASPAAKYDGIPDSPRSLEAQGIQSQPCITSSPLQTSPMSSAYPASGEPSPYGGHKTFMNPPPTFHPLRSFDVKEAGGLGVQEGPAVYDFFPPQRTLPAKRGPFRDQDQREKTARTRKMGSCIRCRMQRIRVSVHQPMHCRATRV